LLLLSSSGLGQFARSFERVEELRGSIKCSEFLDQQMGPWGQTDSQ